MDDFMDYLGYLYVNGLELNEGGEETPIEEEEEDE